jgi:membrane protease YdiL (CAAX protease family)
MSEGVIQGPEPPSPPAGKGRPLLAWAVILLAAGYAAYRQASLPTAAREGLELVTFQLQARFLVGFATLPGQSPAAIYEQSSGQLNRGPYAQRLHFAVLAGELAGPEEARKQLAALDEAWRESRQEDPPPPDDARLRTLLDRLYRAYEEKKGADVLPEGDREELRRRLGWLGELALTPQGSDEAARAAVLAPARRAALAFAAGGLGFLLTIVVGLALLTLAVAFGAAGRLRAAFATGSPFGGVYAETFAAWMVLFLALGQLARLVPVGERSRMLVSDVVLLASLAALAWPRLRGVPWARLRQDLGLYAGRRPAAEAGLGLACYAATLPLLVLGALAMLALTKVRQTFGPLPDPFGPSGDPSHPIAGFLSRPDWWVRVQVFLGAAVVAPLVEETMFRGVLYRHLREASAGLGRAASVVGSALVVSLVFAGIHPQGWQGVPPLAALAFGFALAREWRGTLVPAMVAHGVNNAAITLLIIAALG